MLINQGIAQLWIGPPVCRAPVGPCLGKPIARSVVPERPRKAAFGIAFAVLFFDRVVGGFFLGAAALIGVGRVFVGAHYPTDVLAGCLVGLGSAFLVVRLAQPLVDRLVRGVERLTDPLLAPVW